MNSSVFILYAANLDFYFDGLPLKSRTEYARFIFKSTSAA